MKYINKRLVISFLILIIISICTFFWMYIESKPYLITIKEQISSQSIWYNLFGGRYGQLTLFCSPIIILIGVLPFFYYTVREKMMEYHFTRQSKKVFLIKNIGKMYVKSIFLFPLYFVVTFFLLKLFLPETNIIENSSLAFFPNDLLETPNLFLINSVINVFFYGIVIINIGIITIPYANNFYLCLLISFISYQFINFAIGIFTVFNVFNLNVYLLFMGNSISYSTIQLIVTFILIFISYIIIYFQYFNFKGEIYD